MQTAEEVRGQLTYGDYAKLGKALGVTRTYAFRLLNRPTAKRHEEALKEAIKIVEFNESLEKA